MLRDNNPGCQENQPWPSVRLYDVIADPTECVNVAEDHPDLVKTLLQKVAAYQKEARPWEWIPIDCNSDPYLRDGVWRPWRAV